MRLIVPAVLVALLLPACASMALRSIESMPLLPAAAFGADAERMQRLTVSRDEGGARLSIDAAVEIDATEVRVAGFLLGQRVLLLSWDGSRLAESRDPVVPAAVQGRDILRDLQLVYWPSAAIRPVLPRGCELQERQRRRSMTCDGRLMVEVERADDQPLGAATLHNLARRYRIAIEAAQ